MSRSNHRSVIIAASLILACAGCRAPTGSPLDDDAPPATAAPRSEPQPPQSASTPLGLVKVPTGFRLTSARQVEVAFEGDVAPDLLENTLEIMTPEGRLLFKGPANLVALGRVRVGLKRQISTLRVRILDDAEGVLHQRSMTIDANNRARITL